MIHSSTSARALARVMPDSAARRWRSQLKPSSAAAQSSDGGVTSNGERGVADHDLAGEDEAAGIDLARAGGVGGAQILRRDQQPVGRAGTERQAHERMAVTRPRSLAAVPRARNTDNLRSFRDRNARHRARRLPHAAGCPRVPRPDHSEGAGGQPRSDLKPLQAGRHRSRRGRPCADRDRRVGRAACADRRPASMQLARPPTSAAAIGCRRSRGSRASSVRDHLDRPPRARASRCNRPACRPAWSARPRVRCSRRCKAASVAMSASRLSQGMSGWRRMVPVDEQGASSSTASNGSRLPFARRRRRRFRPSSASRARFCRSRSSRAGERSTAVTRAPAAASCAVLPPGAAHRSATRVPPRRPAAAPAAPLPRPAPTRRLRHSPAARDTGPCTVARTEPVGSTRPPSAAPNARRRAFTVRSSAGSRPLAAAIARAVSAP